jgi:hypothetical protein
MKIKGERKRIRTFLEGHRQEDRARILEIWQWVNKKWR